MAAASGLVLLCCVQGIPVSLFWAPKLIGPHCPQCQARYLHLPAPVSPSRHWRVLGDSCPHGVWAGLGWAVKSPVLHVCGGVAGRPPGRGDTPAQALGPRNWPGLEEGQGAYSRQRNQGEQRPALREGSFTGLNEGHCGRAWGAQEEGEWPETPGAVGRGEECRLAGLGLRACRGPVHFPGFVVCLGFYIFIFIFTFLLLFWRLNTRALFH